MFIVVLFGWILSSCKLRTKTFCDEDILEKKEG